MTVTPSDAYNAYTVEKKLLETFERQAQAFVGKTVKLVRYMTEEERRLAGWGASALCLCFTDGSQVYATRDDEGNGPGTLVLVNVNGTGDTFPALRA